MSDATILVADDHPLFRDALKIAVSRAAPTARVLEAGSVAEAADQVRAAERLDLILLDLRMPDAEGFSGLALLHAERPGTPIIVISALDAADAAVRARRYGAAGFLSKTADLGTIQSVVCDALSGRGNLQSLGEQTEEDAEIDDMAARIATLTPAQIKVLLGVLAGRLNKQIAHDLSISEATVKAHMTAVFRKLGVQNRTQAVIAARALGLDTEELSA